MANKAMNRNEVVLVEHNRISKWIPEKLGKNESTVSRWCTNSIQQSVNTLSEMAKLLTIDIKDLLSSINKAKS